jgi:hypothetical protein
MLSHGPSDDKEAIPPPVSNRPLHGDGVAVLELAHDGRPQRALAGPAPCGRKSTGAPHSQRESHAVQRSGRPLAQTARRPGSGPGGNAVFATGGLGASASREAACQRPLRAAYSLRLQPGRRPRARRSGTGLHRSDARGQSLKAMGMKGFFALLRLSAGPAESRPRSGAAGPATRAFRVPGRPAERPRRSPAGSSSSGRRVAGAERVMIVPRGPTPPQPLKRSSIPADPARCA